MLVRESDRALVHKWLRNKREPTWGDTRDLYVDLLNYLQREVVRMVRRLANWEVREWRERGGWHVEVYAEKGECASFSCGSRLRCWVEVHLRMKGMLEEWRRLT